MFGSEPNFRLPGNLGDSRFPNSVLGKNRENDLCGVIIVLLGKMNPEMTSRDNREYGRLPTDMLVMVSWMLFPIIFVFGEAGANWAIAQPRRAGMISFAMLVLGAISLFVSRLPLYRQGQFWTIGSRLLPPRARRWYRLAYWFIVPNVVFLLLLWVIVA